MKIKENRVLVQLRRLEGDLPVDITLIPDIPASMIISKRSVVIGGLLLKTLMEERAAKLGMERKKMWQDMVLAIKLYSFLDEKKIKGFSIEYLALVAVQSVDFSCSNSVFRKMKELLSENVVICLNQNHCNICKKFPGSSIESKSFCSGFGRVFYVDMREAFCIFSQLNVTIKRGKEAQLAKMLPFILEQKRGREGG